MIYVSQNNYLCNFTSHLPVGDDPQGLLAEMEVQDHAETGPLGGKLTGLHFRSKASCLSTPGETRARGRVKVL